MERPDLTSDLSETEFRRWYWTKDELVTFARELAVSRSGNKPEIADRIAASLAGRPDQPGPFRPDTEVAGSDASTPTKRRRASRLAEPITGATVIPPGQTASQQLRPFFVERIGPAFHYDVFMRTFLSNEAGRTLDDAVDHWHATRGAEKPETLASLEYVRFTKAWHLAHPDGTAAQCRDAWRRHRSLPVDERPGPEA